MKCSERETMKCSVVSDSLRPHRLQPTKLHGILQSRILEQVAIPSPGDLSNPGTNPRYLTKQADS